MWSTFCTGCETLSGFCGNPMSLGLHLHLLMPSTRLYSRTLDMANSMINPFCHISSIMLMKTQNSVILASPPSNSGNACLHRPEGNLQTNLQKGPKKSKYLNLEG